MLESFAGVPVLFGFLLGLSLAAPLGPVNAIITTRAAENGFWSGASVGFGAASADVVLCTLMALGVVHVLAALPGLNVVLALGGGALMLWFAWGAFRSARNMTWDVGDAAVDDAARATFASGVAAGFLIAITSPYGLAWWLSFGTQLFQDYGVSVFAGFFGGVLAWVLSFSAMIVWARSRVRGLVRGVTFVSAVVLAAFALVFLWRGGASVLGWA